MADLYNSGKCSDSFDYSPDASTPDNTILSNNHTQDNPSVDSLDSNNIPTVEASDFATDGEREGGSAGVTPPPVIIRKSLSYPPNLGQSVGKNTHPRYSPNAEVQATVEKLLDWGLAPIPVAPKQDSRKKGCHRVEYPKRKELGYSAFQGEFCVLDKEAQPLPKFTGKNPSYLDRNGQARTVQHRFYQKQMPTEQELFTWFANPNTGVGTLGGHGGVDWIDIDAKNFDTQEECDRVAQSIITAANASDGWIERTGSNGWRIAIIPKEKPTFTNFATEHNGKHIGEALYQGRYTVLAPSVHPNGNKYTRISDGSPVEVESLESCGIFPCADEVSDANRKIEREIKKQSDPNHGEPSDPTGNPWDIRNFATYFDAYATMGDDWASARCPSHNGKSQTSFRVNLSTGQYKCYGCKDTKAIYKAGLALAQSRGYQPQGSSDDSINAPQFDLEAWVQSKRQTEYETYCESTEAPLEFDEWLEQSKIEWVAAKQEKDYVAYCETTEAPLEFDSWKRQNYVSYYLTNTLRRRPSILLSTPDLTKAGIDRSSHDLALASPKATHKTNWIKQDIAHNRFVNGFSGEENKIFLLTHRIALGRNLSRRLGLEWRNDVEDRNYSKQLASCVEGLAVIDVTDFDGAHLYIDEARQVLRHLLTSETCKKFRPFYISKVKWLIRNAKTITIADADLDEETIRFFETLRSKPMLVVKNDHKSKGYRVNFVKCDDDTGLTRKLIDRIKSKSKEDTIFVPTDGKNFSTALGGMLKVAFPDLKVLVVNSKTANNKEQRDFIDKPDEIINSSRYDVVIASPTLGTGVSIESDRIDSVFGFFSGKSINAEDMSQSLFRVRKLVDRFVWCAEFGSGWSYSSSTSASRIKEIIQSKAKHDVSLCDQVQSLQEIFTEAEFTWSNSPFTDLYCHYIATSNRSAHNLQRELLTRLEMEGHQIEIKEELTDEELRAQKSQIKLEIKLAGTKALINASDYTEEQIRNLQKNKNQLTEKDMCAIEKFWIKEFYAVEKIDENLIGFDQDGKGRKVIKELENLKDKSLASERAAQSLHRAMHIRNPLETVEGEFSDSSVLGDRIAEDLTLWDSDSAISRRDLRVELGLEDFLKDENLKRVYTAEDYQPYADRIRERAASIKKILGITVNDKMTNTQIVNSLLRQFGCKMSSTQKRVDGERIYFYSRDLTQAKFIDSVLDRRRQKREEWKNSEAVAVIPPREIISKSLSYPPNLGQSVGKNTQSESQPFTEADIEDYRNAIEDAGNDTEMLQLLKDVSPALYKVAFSRISYQLV